VLVRNERFHRGIDDLQASWALRVDGAVVADGALDLPAVGPRGSAAVPVPLPEDLDDLVAQAHEVHLDVVTRQAEQTPWAPAGHVVAWDQHRLGDLEPGRVRALPSCTEALSVAPGASGWDAVTLDGHQLLGALGATVWRPMTDNDGTVGGPAWQLGRAADWHEWGLDRLAAQWDDPAVEDTEGVLRIRAHGRLVTPTGSAQVDWTRTVTVEPLHAVRIDETVVVPDAFADVPRVGAVVEVADGLDDVAWWGLGPHECYPDRLGSAVVGRHRRHLDDMAEPLVHPQEHGTRTQVREVVLSGPTGRLVVAADPHGPLLAFRVGRDRDANLETCPLASELPSRTGAELHVDVAVRGVGTGACGPDTRPAYRVGPGTYRWTWWLGVLGPTSG